MVGWLIRFVHKRDRPVESVVMAYSRLSVLRKAPAASVVSIQERLKARDTKLSQRSYFLSASAPRMKKGSIRGAGQVALAVSRRNSTKMPLSRALERYVKSHYRLVGRGGAHRPVTITSRTVTVMTAGVKLNGQAWESKTCCDFQLHVSRAQPDEADEHEIGSVDKFYLVSTKEHGQALFAKIYLHPVVKRLHTVYVVQNHKNAWSVLDTRFVHVDEIVSKYKLARHWKRNTLLCAVPTGMTNLMDDT
jgi:hypothetical protein